MRDDWTPAPTAPSLAAGDVHVWRLPLDVDAGARERVGAWLSADERQRAARFYFDRDCSRFTAGRGQLRQVLAQYLDADPASLRFAYGPRGKPHLAAHELRFNLSHSHDLALLAVSRDRELGLDLEAIRPDFATEQVARRFFSAHELDEFAQVPQEQKARAFFNAWTRKEAYIKARGDGLAIPLASFDVTLTPGAPARLLAVRDANDTTQWSLVALDLDAEYAAAVMIEGERTGQVLRFRFAG